VAAGLISKGGGGLWPRWRGGASASGGGGPRLAAVALGVAAARAAPIGVGGEVGDGATVAWRGAVRHGGATVVAALAWRADGLRRRHARQQRLQSSSSCVLVGAHRSLAIVAPGRRSGGFDRR
jgi:hypothetical protein